MKKLLISFFSFFFTLSFSKAKDITTHIYIQNISNLNLKESKVNLDFYLIFDGFGQKGTLPPYNILNLNGTEVREDIIQDTSNHKVIKINGTLFNEFNYDNFPLDSQVIKIACFFINSKGQDKYVSMNGINIISPQLKIPGWKISSIIHETLDDTLEIKDVTGSKKSIHPIITFKVTLIKEDRYAFLIKLLIPTIVSILIILIGYFVPINQLDSMLSISLGSLFVIISSIIILQEHLPDISYTTTVERLNYICLGFVVVNILNFVLSHYLYQKGKSYKIFRKVMLGISILIYLSMIAGELI